MARTVVMRCCSLASKICTICRFEGESSSFMTYFPGCNVAFGTWMGSLTVRIVRLFHSSARIVGANAAPSSATQDARANALKWLIVTYLLHQRRSGSPAPVHQCSGAPDAQRNSGCKICCRSPLSYTQVWRQRLPPRNTYTCGDFQRPIAE